MQNSVFQDIRNGNKQAIQQRLENSEDLSIKDENGNTVLHIAAQEGEKDILTTLIEYYDNCSYWNYYVGGPTLPSLDEVNNNGDTPLHSAICHDNNQTKNGNRAKIADYLSGKNPNLIQKTNNNNLSPVFIAADTDNPQFIQIFIAHKLALDHHKLFNETVLTYAVKKHKPNTIKWCLHYTGLNNVANRDNKTPIELVIDKEDISLLELFTKELNYIIAGTTVKPIHYAAEKGKRNAFDYIISKNISVNEPDKDGNPPLFYAINSNDEPMMNYLLSRGANLALRNNQGEDAFAVAAFNKHFNLLHILKNKHNVNIDNQDNKGRTNLMRYTIEQNHQGMNELIALGANIRITDNEKENILHKIARIGDQNAANIALNADKNLLYDSNQDGNTPLLVAIQNGHFNLAKHLINAGADINVINTKGDNVLHQIAKKNNPLFHELLNKVNPQLINAKNNDGETPIFFAAQNNNVIAIKNLIQHKTEYQHITTIHGLTPLHYASLFDATEVIKEFEKLGVSLTHCTPRGNNNAHIAAGKGNINTVRYLLQTKPELFEMYNNTGENVFSHAALQDQLEITKLLLQEKHYRDKTVIHTIEALKKNSLGNSTTCKFLERENKKREDKRKEVYATYINLKNLISTNRQLSTQNNFFYGMPQLNKELSAHEKIALETLYDMHETECTQLLNYYLQIKNQEFNQKIRFEEEIARRQDEKQKAFKKQQEAIVAEVLQQQQAELDRIAKANLHRLALEQARLQALQQQILSTPPSAPQQPAPPIATPQSNLMPDHKETPIKPFELKKLAQRVRKQEASTEEIDRFIRESKKIIQNNKENKNISDEEAKELLKIALRINKKEATPKQLVAFIEKITQFINDDN